MEIMAAALTVDLKDSRKMEPERRMRIQRYMVYAAKTLSRLYGRRMIRKFSFIGGDEMQGLLRSPADAYLCLRLLRRLLFPLELHAGIGVGEWETRVDAKNTYYQDGPAYHRAREAVELAKRDRDNGAILIFDEPDAAELRNPAWNAMMNAGFRLTERNTAYQNEIALLLECCYPIITGTQGPRPTPAKAAVPDDFKLLIRLMQSEEAEAVFGTEAPGEKRRPFAGVSPERWSEFVRYPEKTGWTKKSEADPTACRSYRQAHPYGAASTVAEAAGLTRQAVDRALRSANVYEERALAMALAEMLSRAWEEPRQAQSFQVGPTS